MHPANAPQPQPAGANRWVITDGGLNVHVAPTGRSKQLRLAFSLAAPSESAATTKRSVAPCGALSSVGNTVTWKSPLGTLAATTLL